MGTDIHIYVERYNKEYARWEYVYAPEQYRIYPDLNSSIYEQNYYGYEGKNCALFAMLADVRNGLGLDCISAPRGLPNDLSNEVKGIYEGTWKGEAHSESYLTLRELLDFHWQKEIPNPFYETSIDPNGFTKLLKKLSNREKLLTYDIVSYADLAGDFFDVTLMRLTLLTNVNVLPEHIRIIFWFDS